MPKLLRVALRVTVVILVFIGIAALVWFSPHSPYQYGRYVPANLDNAHAYLLKHLPPEELQRIRDMKSEKEMGDYHFGLGMSIRNGWGLWGGSRLSRYFNKLGINHPDDMSGVILDTFWCKLHNQPFRLNERIAFSQEYAKASVVPENLHTPSGEPLKFDTACFRGTDQKPRIIHVAKASDGAVWTYEHDTGLQPMSRETQKVIDDYPAKKSAVPEVP